MRKNIFFRSRAVLFFLLFSGIVSLFAANRIFAAVFDIAQHPGMCFDRYELVGTTTLSIYLHPCASGEVTTPYSVDFGGTINVYSTCVYTYGNCGECVNGQQTCTSETHTPTQYICSNKPTYIQSCVNVDTTPPTINITSPVSGATVSGSQSVVAEASDNVGVTQVKFYLDNTLIQSFTATPYSYIWNTTNVANGSHTLKAEAFDAAGNSSHASVTVNVQNVQIIPCTSYTYSDFSNTCNANGKQTRTILGSYPAGCLIAALESLVPVLEKDCVVCAYTCSDWSVCSANGVQTRTCTASPSSCLPPSDSSLIPALEQTCTPPPVTCTYTCSEWGICSYVTKTQACVKFAHAPSGATCLNQPPTNVTQTCDPAAVNCTYTCTDWGTCSIATKTQGCIQFSHAPSGATCSNQPPTDLTRSCEVFCTSYTYGDWSACANNTQTRSILTKTPADCTDTSTAVLKQPCQTSAVCTSYTYDEWGACTDNTQTRKILTQSPAGCTDTKSAQVLRPCVSIPCATYAYTVWGACDDSGKQTRKVISSLPEVCSGGAAPVLEQKCVPAAGAVCSYSYSIWGDCQPSGMQTRKLTGLTPENCVASEPPVLDQKCDYAAPTVVLPAAVETTVATPSNKPEIPCANSYSAWGACIDGKQKRMVTLSSPEGCVATNPPELEQNCKEKPDVLPTLAADAPAPAPQSMTAATTAPVANLNGRTSSEWQKYYFGSPDCVDAAVCAGPADPDNDSLNNNDEFRFGTNPKSPDTDRDGIIDGYEIVLGRNPLVADTKTAKDAMVYESPKEKGKEIGEIYQVSGVEYDSQNKKLRINGKALPDSYVTIYIYSEQPVILTVKTDSEGNWVYIIDKPADGSHEVYVVVNENSGKVVAKSAPLPFVQTAEAATINYPAVQKNVEKAPAPAKARLWEGYLIFFGTGLAGLLLALAAIGVARNVGGPKKDQ
jgi:hypothetical protein